MVTIDQAHPRCANAELAACNWVVDAPGTRCRSCELTRTRPADGDALALERFAVAETAKRRLVLQTLELGLPLAPRDEATGTGVAFDLLSSAEQAVTTGHAGGVITLDLAESDDVHRERVRTKLSEPYRTVLGHFRHEIGHYLFAVLVDEVALPRVRAHFGDETEDYGEALDRHYREGAPPGWNESFVSEYATMHPAEDWAETFAHYLHIRAVLGTAAAYRLASEGPDALPREAATLASDPARVDTTDFSAIIDTWLPLSYALNAINRSMGEDDLYPFVLAPPVLTKLEIVHDLVPGAPLVSGEVPG